MNNLTSILIIILLVAAGAVGYVWYTQPSEEVDEATIDGTETLPTDTASNKTTNESGPASDYNSDAPLITQDELEQGWYWGEADQKKKGTPADWIHENAGTRSACWHAPGTHCLRAGSYGL